MTGTAASASASTGAASMTEHNVVLFPFLVGAIAWAFWQ